MTRTFKFGDLAVEVDLADRPQWAPLNPETAVVYRAVVTDGAGGAAAAGLPARPGDQHGAAANAVAALCMASVMTRDAFGDWAAKTLMLEAFLGPHWAGLWLDEAYGPLRDAAAGFSPEALVVSAKAAGLDFDG